MPQPKNECVMKSPSSLRSFHCTHTASKKPKQLAQATVAAPRTKVPIGNLGCSPLLFRGFALACGEPLELLIHTSLKSIPGIAGDSRWWPDLVRALDVRQGLEKLIEEH